MIDVKVGDTVKVVGDGQAWDAVVTKAGPVWITIGEGFREQKFRRDDGTDGSGYPSRPRIRSLAQYAADRQSGRASAFLREQGIDLKYDSPWRGREIELANLIRNAKES